LRIAILLLLVSISLFSSYFVSDIKFKGLYHLSADSALEILPFQKGEYVSDREIDRAIKKFFEQNYFEDIWVDYDEVEQILVFNFKEKSTISKISLEGFMDTDEEMQEKLLGIKKGSFLDKSKIEETKNRILEAMRYRGTIDNVVEVRKTELENGTTQLEFIAREGENIVITDLRLDGAKSLPFEEIEDKMSNREKDGMGWLWGRNDGEMKIRELELDKMKIRDFYMENGYLDVVVSDPLADIDFNRYTSRLTYHIQEGKPYDISSVNIQIDRDLFDINQTIESLSLHSGDRFNIVKFRKDMKYLKNLVADEGYPYVQIEPDLEKSSKTHKVDITYKIRTGKKVKIRDVLISGNRATLDRVVRREIYIAPGDYYSLTDIRDSKNNLKRLGYFENVEIEEKPVSDSEMDLIVKVEEGRTGMIQVGGGYSTYLGFTFDAGINDNNVFGSGINLGFSFQYSKISTNYSVTLTNPRLNDSLYSGSFSIHHSKLERTGYTSKDSGFGVSIGRKWTRNFRTSLGYSYNDVKYTNIDPDFRYYDDLEPYIKSSISLSGTYNTTDDYFVPREGVILSDTIEYAGLGGDAEFTKNSLSFYGFLGLLDYIDYDLILRLKSKIRGIKDNGFVPRNESIYMGGVGSVRGYNYYAFPNDGTSAYTSWTSSIEASIPISQSAKLRLTGFVDYGYLGIDGFDGVSIDSDIERGGYGVVLEWISPIAPIQFIFSRPLNDKPGDSTSRFEFTMGRRF